MSAAWMLYASKVRYHSQSFLLTTLLTRSDSLKPRDLCQHILPTPFTTYFTIHSISLYKQLCRHHQIESIETPALWSNDPANGSGYKTVTKMASHVTCEAGQEWPGGPEWREDEVDVGQDGTRFL